MVGIIFNWKDNNDNYAEYDSIGDGIEIFLKEFTDFSNNLKCSGIIKDNLVAALFIAVIDHEYFHVEISNIVDTTGDQEHNIMDCINEWIDQTDP